MNCRNKIKVLYLCLTFKTQSSPFREKDLSPSTKLIVGKLGIELQSIIASPAAIGVAPIALLMASISLTGPAIREVPVSAIASHPC